jgi:hypothetical protein
MAHPGCLILALFQAFDGAAMQIASKRNGGNHYI